MRLWRQSITAQTSAFPHPRPLKPLIVSLEPLRKRLGWFCRELAGCAPVPVSHARVWGVMQAAVLQGHRGALHALLLLFLCAHTRDGGSLGGVSLDSHLRLAGLFAPERAA
jgi:hypothetical protein